MRALRSIGVLLAAGLLVVTANMVPEQPADAGQLPHQGGVTLGLQPAVPGQIIIDGVIRNTWSLDNLALDAGVHEIEFTDVPGWITPPDQTIEVAQRDIVQVSAHYAPTGSLRVTTSPPVDAQIFVDGVPRDQWGLLVDVPAGEYEVCYGPVSGFTSPPRATSVVSVGATSNLVGQGVGGGFAAVRRLSAK
ncbi:MAG: hypothetical protein P8N02_15555, partial [Actinomycetota bacterium]|nr:hypothetical protein [Actinomycetota bacterium]